MEKELKDKLKEIIKFHCNASKKISTELNFKLISATPETIELVKDTINTLEENLLAEIDIM